MDKPDLLIRRIVGIDATGKIRIPGEVQKAFQYRKNSDVLLTVLDGKIIIENITDRDALKPEILKREEEREILSRKGNRKRRTQKFNL